MARFGSTFPNFARGLINSSTIRTDSTLAHWRRYPWALYWQDQIRLRPNLEKYLRSGARVVSNDFEIRGWKPKEVVQLQVGNMQHTIYLYEMAKK